MDGDIMHAKTKEKAEDRRRRICFLDLMGFHLLQDELMVKKNVKSKGKKKSNWSYFCFLLTPLFCILPSGGFLQARQKKKSCIAWYVISFCCSACVCVSVFLHRSVQFESLHLIWMEIFLIHQPLHSVSYFLLSGTSSALRRFWHINMYWQASARMPVNTQHKHTHIHTHLCPPKTCDQPYPIPCNHLEHPHTHIHAYTHAHVFSASIQSNGLGQGLKQWASFP